MSTEKRFRLSHILGMTLNRHEIVDKMSLDEFLREYDITPEEFTALQKALVLGRWRVLRREE